LVAGGRDHHGKVSCSVLVDIDGHGASLRV